MNFGGHNLADNKGLETKPSTQISLLVPTARLSLVPQQSVTAINGIFFPSVRLLGYCWYIEF